MIKQSAFSVLARLRPACVALFLDFDGTLVEIVDRPGDVRVDARTLASLVELETLCGGALAIISGRSVATLDAFFAPHAFALSGVHGYETRGPRGEVMRRAVDGEGLDRVIARVEAFADDNPGLLVERKPGSVSLHYRQRPDLGAAAGAVVADAVQGEAGLKVLPGKMVVEVKAHGGDKGAAIRDFMEKAPFAGRVPVVIGDDVTDEAAFAVVNELGGVSVKVGDGATLAGFMLDDPGAVAEWLEALAARSRDQAVREDTDA